MKYTKPKSRRIFFSASFDWNLIICIVLLNIFGLIMIYSASYYYAENGLHKAPDHFFINQLYFVIGGLALMFAVSLFGTHLYNNWFFLTASIGLSFLLLAAVMVPSLSKSSHGAARWIIIGPVSFQIAEPVKLFMIIFAACFTARLSFEIKWMKELAYYAVFALISLMLLLFSNNMSTAVIVFVYAFLLKMVNAKKLKGFWITIGAVALTGLLILLLIEYVIPYTPEENFRVTRIRAWLHPEDPNYASSEAYQGQLALYAIASGGFFGRGLGRSLIKFRLPEPHNDYILAIIFEELGVSGVLILTILFGYLLYRIFLVYRDSRNRFSRDIVLGVFLHLSLQILMNYGVTLGLLPTMGVTLTFISYGGTSLLFTFIELGLVLSVSRENAYETAHRKALQRVAEGDETLIRLLEEEDTFPAFLQNLPFFRRFGRNQ